MSTSTRKAAANRINGEKSRGPINTASTRYNATKHGLLAAGITELDDAQGYQTILSELTRDYKPVGTMEMFLVKAAALEMVRWQRARRLEAEYITAELNPPLQDPLGDLSLALSLALQAKPLDAGLPAAINSDSAHRLVTTFQRYESFFSNRLFRTLHEMERLQRMRLGEHLPSPLAVDVNVHDETRRPDLDAAQTSVPDEIEAITFVPPAPRQPETDAADEK